MDGVEYSEDGKILIKCPRDAQGTFIIPDGVCEIARSAFEGCKNLTSIEIPKTVTKIGTCAFSGCSNLRSIDIPCNVSIIESYTFYDCPLLSSIFIAEGVEKIEDNAFTGCTGLFLYNIPSSVLEIGSNAFQGTGLREAQIYPHTKVIENGPSFFMFRRYGDESDVIREPYNHNESIDSYDAFEDDPDAYWNID